MMEVYYIDRKTGKKEKEIVVGDRYLQWMYGNKVGSSFLETIVKKKIVSSIYGRLQDLPISRRKIDKFIRELNINMEETEKQSLKEYHNFNEFFIRRLKAETRPICNEEKTLVSPADGRMLVYENIDIDKVVQVKGQIYSLEELFQNSTLAKEYQGGSCIIVRLNPADYHRFHFPDDGMPQETVKIKGSYYSVNPIALRQVASLYCQNKREITIFQSDSFQKISMIEVGATCVGSIIQTYTPGSTVKKGEEKGYFKFGGSTVILFLKANTVKIDEDLVANTKKGLETKVNMGERIGTSL
ncbi:MAG: phosphatidylserine decarboxylase [Clostridiaceae bacterium]|nr:phosphatidylserine decarboxylase [Clostridiaceae bacterium]